MTDTGVNQGAIGSGGDTEQLAQFNLEANGYQSHEQWLTDWQDARSGQFMLVGSKDETNGCQNCQISPDGLLKIRVAPGLEHQFGKYIIAEGIHFAYGQAICVKQLTKWYKGGLREVSDDGEYQVQDLKSINVL